MARRAAAAWPPISGMATRNNRRSETGLSLIEALVIVTITALIALVLLPLASRVSARNFAFADQGLGAEEAAIAEATVRGLLRNALPDSVVGAQNALSLSASLPADTLCTRSQGRLSVTLSVEGNRLVCSSGARTRVLLTLQQQPRFAYSADARAWGATWTGDGTPFVRLTGRRADGSRIVMVARAGSIAEPASGP